MSPVPVDHYVYMHWLHQKPSKVCSCTLGQLAILVQSWMCMLHMSYLSSSSQDREVYHCQRHAPSLLLYEVISDNSTLFAWHLNFARHWIDQILLLEHQTSCCRLASRWVISTFIFIQFRGFLQFSAVKVHFGCDIIPQLQWQWSGYQQHPSTFHNWDRHPRRHQSSSFTHLPPMIIRVL